MGSEINFLSKYPQAPRNTAARAAHKTPEDVEIARQFGEDFFDGERRHGYGGYTYSPTRWRDVVAELLAHYKPASVLDVGCAKGYMLLEFMQQAQYLRIAGIDISDYAIRCAPSVVRQHISYGNADYLEFSDSEFDLAVSINTLHNLTHSKCVKALKELSRVSKRQYVTVDAYRTDEERARVMDWNLTARTILHVDEWLELFAEAGYVGDYSWWLP